MKKAIAIALGIAFLCTAFTSCGGGFSKENKITVISRESGSGTRGAFIELFGVEQKDTTGNKVDRTIATADINADTGIVLTNVASNKNSIGYISLGALNNTVKALKIDGASATVANIKNGTYKIARPFNIATKGDLSAVADDFIKFILSTEGQAVVSAKGYIALDNAAAYNGVKPSGKVTISGSSSVTPLMEKLKEAYLKINTNATIEIQQSDSSSGMIDASEGISDIGMASRELKDSELANGLAPTEICMDGIAVIVNNANTIEELTKDQVMKIYIGEAVKWADVID
ncbi:Phosphate-binding protein PstS 2 [bioreactor metagenome]|uniref:Phosphate-binding protein PstS 2 n=1 Tax=bioreactor metagenome TaxID=1076179 RepID=A0A645BRQ0_9ZZZZ|nr:substrate-binding domain-containing protein [Oscillospiraceae bacterium]